MRNGHNVEHRRQEMDRMLNKDKRTGRMLNIGEAIPSA